MLRVGLLMDFPSPHMVSLLDALARRTDCAVQVVYFRQSAPERNWGAPPGDLPHVFATTKRARLSLWNVKDVAGLVPKTRVDVWIVNACYTSPETWNAVRQINAAALPWVYMNEPIRPRGKATALKVALLRRLLSKAAGVIGMGREATSRYVRILNRPVPSVSVPYFINLDDFLEQPLPCAPAVDEPIRFLAVGQLIHRKGFDVLLAACALLPKSGWTLTIAGDGPLRAELEQAFKDRWQPPQVSFLGELRYADRVAAFSEKHVFVFTSRWDGWGMAPVEAMSAGLPVISTDQVMSMKDFIQEGVNGYLVEIENPIVLAERMRGFIDSPDKIHPMGAHARAAIKEYRPELGAANLIRFLRTLVTAASQRGVALDGTESRKQTKNAPTWKSLTTPSSYRQRLRQATRALAKRMVIDAAMAVPWRSSVPAGHRILVYHLILSEDKARFAAHLGFLKDYYHLVTVRQLMDNIDRNDVPPMVAITFDDGFQVLMSDALDSLQTFDVKASFYVPTGFIELASHPLKAAQCSGRLHYYQQPLQPMTVDHLQTLHNLGHEIASHGVSHLGLNEVSRSLAAAELSNSRQRIAEWLGEAPIGFAYPYGHFRSSLGVPAEWVAEAGYEYAVTLQRGRLNSGTDKMLLPREHVEGFWRVRDLQYFLSRSVR